MPKLTVHLCVVQGIVIFVVIATSCKQSVKAGVFNWEESMGKRKAPIFSISRKMGFGANTFRTDKYIIQLQLLVDSGSISGY